MTKQVIDLPALGVLPDRTTANEQTRLDVRTRSLHNVHDVLDIRDHRAATAVGSDGQVVVRDLPAKPSDVLLLARSGSWNAHARALDAELVHHVNDADFCFDWRIEHRRTLQSVAQRLVVDLDVAPMETVWTVFAPIEDEIGLLVRIQDRILFKGAAS